MSPKPDPETVLVICENTEAMRWTLESVLRGSGLRPMLGPPALADAGTGAPAGEQSPNDIFATAQAKVVVFGSEMGANTVTILMANRATLRVRLFGIDVPESPQGEYFPGQPYGPEAMAHLQGLVQDQRVRVEIYGVDQYRRLLGTLFIDARNINLAMVEVGLAEVYRYHGPRDPYQAQYEAAEADARAGKRGMWILGNQYESPRDYRQRTSLSQ